MSKQVCILKHGKYKDYEVIWKDIYLKQDLYKINLKPEIANKVVKQVYAVLSGMDQPVKPYDIQTTTYNVLTEMGYPDVAELYHEYLLIRIKPEPQKPGFLDHLKKLFKR